MRSVMWRRAAVMAVLLAATTACSSARGRLCRDVPDPDELGRLATVTDSTVVAMRTATDTQLTSLRIYLQSVLSRADMLDQCGRVSTPADLRTAGSMALTANSLGQEAVERAYRWSRRAVEADSSDRRSWRVMAHAWDQLQLLQKQRQWFATVVTCPNTLEGRCAIAPIDTTHVTDPQRAELGLRTIAQQRERVDSLNRARGRP